MTARKKIISKYVFLGMTNAEVLHQVEHGYRMQAPQGCPHTTNVILFSRHDKRGGASPG
jgi:hypothetical protein